MCRRLGQVLASHQQCGKRSSTLNIKDKSPHEGLDNFQQAFARHCAMWCLASGLPEYHLPVWQDAAHNALNLRFVKSVKAAFLGDSYICDMSAARLLSDLPLQTVVELMRISAEQRTMAVHQLHRFSANRQSHTDLSKCASVPPLCPALGPPNENAQLLRHSSRRPSSRQENPRLLLASLAHPAVCHWHVGIQLCPACGTPSSQSVP